ncbi:MAG: radical SAM protein [Chloroflexi bacterium]|nr:radical SAM protein [Chloroflexota bacterium]
MFEPAYLRLHKTGELAARARAAYQHLERCDLCAQHCGVNRHTTIQGAVCRTGARAVLASYGAHFGEEPPLVGRGGSGTIFFAWCNLRCVYCQNYEISQLGEGNEVEPEDLAAAMLRLQARGCHNINFVSPSHVVAPILAATLIAAQAGLRIPIVYNTGGYDSPEALALLDGVVDLYMPDMKYADAEIARQYSKARDYPAINRAAAQEMHRQVGDLQMDEWGIATRGLLVRHLLLPDDLAGTRETLRWLAHDISPRTYVNVMAQYRPRYHASHYPELNRTVTLRELLRAQQFAAELGLGINQ